MRLFITMRLFIILSLISTSAFAEQIQEDSYSTSLDYAQVKEVRATQSSNGTWCFATSVRHNDEGWEHYADGWEVVDLEGNQLGVRELAHPHDTEQPFTRSKCNIQIPAEITEVKVRAKCNLHGFGGKEVIVDLTED